MYMYIAVTPIRAKYSQLKCMCS